MRELGQWPDKLCAPRRASNERDCGQSPLFAGESPVRTEIAEAGSHLAQGLFRLVELVVGRRVYMTSGPGSTSSTRRPARQPGVRQLQGPYEFTQEAGMTTDILTLTRVAGEEKARQYLAMTTQNRAMFLAVCPSAFIRFAVGNHPSTRRTVRRRWCRPRCARRRRCRGGHQRPGSSTNRPHGVDPGRQLGEGGVGVDGHHPAI